MPEEITGSKPVRQSLPAEQQTLRDHQEVYERPDLSEMDKLAAELLKKKTAPAEGDPDKPAVDPDKPVVDPDKPAVDPDKPAVDPDKPAVDPDKPVVDPDKPAVDPDKPVVDPDKPAVDPDKPVVDPYPDVQLPPNIKGKSAEAWSTVKTRFAKDLSERDQKIATLESKVQEIEASRGKPLTKELEEELESLRDFKTRLDVEADPNFSKKYDAGINQLREFIYAQLKSTGKVSEELLKGMKKLGGPDEVANMDRVFETIENPQVQRLVQAKLDEIEVLKYEKSQELKKAKDNIREYVRQRSDEYLKSVDNHRVLTQKQLDEITPKFAWLKEPAVPAASASEAEKKAYEDLVGHQKEIREYLDIAVKDDSAEMRATLIAGVAQLLNLKREHAFLKTQFEAASTALKEANAKIEKFKKSSTTRFRESNAPPSDRLPGALKLLDPHTNAGLALDDLRRQQVSSGR